MNFLNNYRVLKINNNIWLNMFQKGGSALGCVEGFPNVHKAGAEYIQPLQKLFIFAFPKGPKDSP
jgi:hypothetical protein